MSDSGFQFQDTGQADLDIRRVVVTSCEWREFRGPFDRHIAKKRLTDLSCFHCDRQRDEDKNQLIR
jgi:hypothetical protein